MEKGHTYTLDEFRNAQFEQLEEVYTMLICDLLLYKYIHFLRQFSSSRKSSTRYNLGLLCPFILQRYPEFFDFYLLGLYVFTCRLLEDWQSFVTL